MLKNVLSSEQDEIQKISQSVRLNVLNISYLTQKLMQSNSTDNLLNIRDNDIRQHELILKNAGVEELKELEEGKGLDVVTGNTVDMVKAGIIDPLLVTKSALTNAASVATTILSTDCVINNIRA